MSAAASPTDLSAGERNAPPNPYVGPRPFDTGERLFGREREVRELLDLFIAERIVLLYAPSGAGKTSLLRAALIPRLQAEGFSVLPVARVNTAPPPGTPPATNRHLLSVLRSLEEGLSPEQQLPLEELQRTDLDAYFDRRASLAAQTAASAGEQEGAPSQVLIIDQFEELLTVDPGDRGAKREFFAQLGAALRDRRRWALLSMREDYLGSLDPALLRLVPTRLATRYRLDLLDVAAATAAVTGPAAAVGVPFSEEAAAALVDDLAKVRVQQQDGSTREQPGQYVEPVQLQVVCQRLWENGAGRWEALPAGERRIAEADLAAVGDVDSALTAFYAERVRALAERPRLRDLGVRERDIREWFDRHLITPQGIRGQVPKELDRNSGAGQRVDRGPHRGAPGATRGAPGPDLVRADSRPADAARAGGQRGLARGPPGPAAAPGGPMGRPRPAAGPAAA